MPIRQFQAQRMHAPRDFQAIANESVCVEIGAEKVNTPYCLAGSILSTS